MVEAYGSLIDRYSWDWFATLTFREEVHPEVAHKCFMRWTHGLNRNIFGVRYWKRPADGVTWARGLEYQKRGVIHYHALIGRVPGDVRRLDYMDAWDELAGYARIEPYDATKGARFYLGKYVLKGGQVDIGGPVGSRFNREQLLFWEPVTVFGQVVATPEPDRGVPH